MTHTAALIIIVAICAAAVVVDRILRRRAIREAQILIDAMDANLRRIAPPAAETTPSSATPEPDAAEAPEVTAEECICPWNNGYLRPMLDVVTHKTACPAFAQPIVPPPPPYLGPVLHDRRVLHPDCVDAWRDRRSEDACDSCRPVLYGRVAS